MKKLLIASVVFIYMMSACDKTLYLNYKIQNNCNDTIFVDGFGGSSKAKKITFSLKVAPNTLLSFYQGTTIMAFGCSKEDIPHYIDSLSVKEKGYILNYNPLYRLEHWNFVQIKDNTYEATLNINPDDFE